uniref:Protein transport protein Sec31A n=1 Tax=Ornithodoros turicata TaxID=34597 RepID=A0A2R5LKK4_9ACAR
MKVKEIDRTANIAWSPSAHHPIYIAAGTAAQQLDSTFSTTASLEIYSLNLTEPGLDMSLVGTLPSEHRFHKIAWGCHGMDEDELSSGILVGGADGGHLLVYNPAKLIKGEDALICEKEKHTGPIYALDFNVFQPNLLASGSTDSEIFIWDLNSPSAPMTPGAKSQPHEDISCLAWNRQVQHILASTFPARCVVWDLRKNEPIIKVSDTTSRLHCKSVAWHPEVATQLCVASEDDHAPVVQLWDLRFATSPLKSLEQHQRGVLAIAWCPQDPDLLLSCGKDNRILCWNPNSSVSNGELVCEIPTGNQWNFDVAWCPRNPAVIASSSFDGHVGVYSLLGGQQQVQPSAKLAESFPGADAFQQPLLMHQQQQQQQAVAAQRFVSVSLQKPPKWLRRPVGASFGFGGKLVSFSEECPPPSPGGNQGRQMAPRLVNVSQVITEHNLVAQSSKLESALSTGNLSDFCQNKIASSTDVNDRLTWSFLQANFEPSPRAKMLSLLGYDPQDISTELSPLIQDENEPGVEDTSQDLNNLSLNATTEDALDRDEAAFETIAEQNRMEEYVPFRICTDNSSTDGLLNRALLTGNVEAAVSLCIKDKRWTDALILAQAGGQALLQRTQKQYFEQAASDSAKLISAVVNSNWADVVKKCDISCWKEALAAVLTYAKPEEFPVLCEILSSRLESEENTALVPYAMLCYVCAGNLEKLAKCWVRVQKNVDSPSNLQELVEQVMILRAAVSQLGGQPCSIQTGTLSALLGQYASVLAAQGSLNSALIYLADPSEPNLAILQDRIFQCLGMKSPHFPFRRVEIKGEPVRVAPPAMGKVPSATPQGWQSNVYGQTKVSTDVISKGRVVYQGVPQVVPVSQVNQYNHQNANYGYPPQQQQQQQQQQRPEKMFQPPVPTVPLPPAEPVVPVPHSKGIRSRYPSVHDPCVYNDTSYNQPPYYQQTPYSQSSSYVTSQPYSQPQGFYSPDQGYGDQNATYTFSNSSATQFTNVYGTAGAPSNPTPPPPASHVPPPGMTSVFSGNNPPSGWNDPPPLKPSSKVPSVPTFDMASAMTTPLIGASAPTVPEPPQAGLQGGYMPPPAQLYAPVQPVAPTVAQPAAPPAPAPEPVKEKGPIPQEHQILQEVFENLRQCCVQAATNQQSRRKLDDVARKLEHLYDRLRDSMVSQPTVHGLHQLVQAIQQRDYATAMGVHSHLASTSNFAETSSFMPGLKTLLLIAQHLSVHVH